MISVHFFALDFNIHFGWKVEYCFWIKKKEKKSTHPGHEVTWCGVRSPYYYMIVSDKDDNTNCYGEACHSLAIFSWSTHKQLLITPSSVAPTTQLLSKANDAENTDADGWLCWKWMPRQQRWARFFLSYSGRGGGLFYLPSQGWLQTGGWLRTLGAFSLEMYWASHGDLSEKCYLLVILRYRNNDFSAFDPVNVIHTPKTSLAFTGFHL